MKQLNENIEMLIASKKEGTYWDFKEIPHENKADLLHDILCLANAKHKGDRYLIFGVSDPSRGANILGLPPDMPNRRNQQQFIDFLRSKVFAGSIRPDISLHSIIVGNREIDVLQILDQPFKPYYLISTYSEGKRSARANHIYTRIGDTNTPIDSSADLLHVEHMWRERFHLDIPPREKMLYLLSRPHEWIKDLGNSQYAYNKDHPEYKVEFSALERSDSPEAYCYFYPNPTTYYGLAKLYYHSTILQELEYMTCDEMRIFLPVPKITRVSKDDFEGWYHYYTMHDLTGIFLKFLTDDTCSFSSGRILEPPFLIFKDNLEAREFKNKVIQHLRDIIHISPSGFAKTAKREKENANDKTPIDPIFLDQVHQFFSKNKKL